MRLGLSDSMRSSASNQAEPTSPQPAQADVRRVPCASSGAQSQQNPPQQRTPTLNPQRRETIKRAHSVRRRMTASSIALSIVLSLFLAATGTVLLGPSVQEWRESVADIHEQLAHLENSVLSLGDDTARLTTAATFFLQNCQDLQVSAMARTELIASSATQSLTELAKARVELHGNVTKEALEFHAQQKQRIQEMRERLLSMNITLPVQVLVRPMPEFSDEAEGVQSSINDDTADELSVVLEEGATTPKTLERFASAMKKLTFYAEKSLQQRDGSHDFYQRLSAQSIDIQAMAHTVERDMEQRFSTKPKPSSSSSSSFFYALVACVSVGYLWNAVTNTQKELKRDDREWSPVPKILSHLKTFLNSIVVVDNLREHVEVAKDSNDSADAW